MPKRRGKRWAAVGYDKAIKDNRHLGTFDTRGEAADCEAEHRLRNQRGTSRVTCDDFARRWPTEYPRPREATTITNTERLKPFIRDFKGVRLGAVDKPTARKWALKHKSSAHAVRAMYNDAVRDGLVEAPNPFADLRLPRSKGRKDLIVLTESELGSLADLALHPAMELGEYGRKYRAQVLFSGGVGLRPGELFALEPGDVSGQLCNIERAYSSKSRKVTPTKSYLRRTVIVPPFAQDALAELAPNRSGLLFSSPRDHMWTQSSHSYLWGRLRRFAAMGPLAGVVPPGMDYYELRHAGATMLLERGVTPWDVAIQLGHNDGGQLVMELYGHPSHAGARARVLAAWDAQTGPTPIRSGAFREQAS